MAIFTFPKVLIVSLLITLARAQTTDPKLPPADATIPTPSLAPALSEPSIPPPVLTIPPPKAPEKIAKLKPKKPANIFAGKLMEINKTNLTLTVENKAKKSTVYAITSNTRMSRGGKPSTFSDALLGDAVRGVFAKGKEGKLTVISLDYGPSVAKPSQDLSAPKEVPPAPKAKVIQITPLPPLDPNPPLPVK